MLVTKELDENILPEAVTLVDTILAALTFVVTYTLPVATTLDVVTFFVTNTLDENILPEAVTFVDITLGALTLPEATKDISVF